MHQQTTIHKNNQINNIVRLECLRQVSTTDQYK